MSDNNVAYPLILNKVASPHYATPVLRRSRLLTWLSEVSSCRAVVIAADAGYGKTTLLYQWEQEVDFPCYWYKLDRTDRDWTFHISYLIEAIGKRHRGFGQRANSMLQQMGGPGSSRPGVAAYLLAEMHETLTEPCSFFIDDWQYVNSVTEVRGLWNQILRDAPPTCRFIFSSRVKPKLQFARFKTHAGYAELRTNALRFTELEIGELFRDVYDDPLQPNEIEEVERRTEGWAASLQLLEVSLRDRESLNDRAQFIHSITATTDSSLFDFLAEEVLDQQSEAAKNFLLSTSILQQITAEVAGRLTGVHDARRELTGLEHRGLFTHQLDGERYRYHNLFREFLERRLQAERSEAEVVGLHIHAASYFETTEQWPEAIHHYLRSGLQRQAGRLIAKHGEDVASSGRLGQVDQWMADLPPEMIRQNARLSLLHGEAFGIQGEWARALDALERSRQYFARKGDARMEALACLKLSTVYSNFGDAERAAEAAEAGVNLAPPDASITRLRLEGNLAVTRTWLDGSLPFVVRECRRLALEAEGRGLEHYAAIGFHNLGEMELRMGDIAEAVENLERAAKVWSGMPTSPFANNENLTAALVLDGQTDRARALAIEAVRQTMPWRRPNALALLGMGAVLMSEGHIEEAIDALERAASNGSSLGSAHITVFAQLIEALYLAERPIAEIQRVGDELAARPVDSRYLAEAAPAFAILDHISPRCDGACQRRFEDLIQAEASGAVLPSVLGRVKIGSLAFEHSHLRAKRAAWSALERANERGFVAPIRMWVRRYSPFVRYALHSASGPSLLSALVIWDPEGWRSSVVSSLGKIDEGERSELLVSVVQNANRATIDALRAIEGTDVADARRHLQRAQATRFYLRTLGGVSLRRGNWNGPAVTIEKRRVRALLAVLAAHTHTVLTRDMAIDLLWPEADGDAAVNSLNQTVFQLRRYLDPDYKQGESPDYVFSTSEQIGLNEELVHTDLHVIRMLPERLRTASWPQRQMVASKAIDLVAGEFLADLRYEGWASRLQMAIHNEIRSRLLPIAVQADGQYDLQVALDAAAALVGLDQFDEAATLALADCLSRSGRRVAARRLLAQYSDQVRRDLDEEPPAQVTAALTRLS